ncbi:hypothetical protein D3C78_1648650 [compost metagenome]
MPRTRCVGHGLEAFRDIGGTNTVHFFQDIIVRRQNVAVELAFQDLVAVPA